MFIDKRNLYSIFFLSGILLLVLFLSRFSYGVEGLTTTTPVINATASTVDSSTTKPAAQVMTKPAAQVVTTTPVIQATTSPTVTTDPKPTSSTTVKNLASLIETPVISTATIVKISDIQAQVTNLRTILQKDVIMNSVDSAKLLQSNPDIQKALSLVLDKPVRNEIEILLRNFDNIYMNLYLQTVQIQDNITNFKNQYQNL